MHRSSGPVRSLLLATAICFAVVGCRSGDDADNAAEDAANKVLPPLPETEPLLDRAGMLDAIRAAASAFSAGIDDGEAQTALNGRRFSLRIPFGCSIDANEDDPAMQMRLAVREDGRSYRVSALPVIDAEAAGIVPADDNEEEGESDEADGVPAVESVEGFWFHRPWLLSDQCPSLGEDADPDASALTLNPNEPGEASSDEDEDDEDHSSASHWPHRIAGIARFTTSEDSRVGNRDGRDYSKVVTLNEGEQPPSGLFLVLEGRLRAWPGGKAIRCLDQGPDKPPQCLAGAAIDRVAFERIDDKSVVAEWEK